MANERDEEQFGETQGSTGQQGQQQPTGQQNQQTELGQAQQGPQAGEPGSPETMSGQDAGQDSPSTGIGGQSSSGQTQPSETSETITSDRSDQGGSGDTGKSGGSSGGFVGSQGSGSDEYLQERGGSEGQTTQPSSAKATEGSDFANQGRGATDEEGNESDSDSTGGGQAGSF